MQNQSNNPFLDFMSAKYLLTELFDISLNENDFVEKGMRIWRSMGNVCQALHEYEVTVGQDCTIQMPCNTERIEAVTVSSCLLESDINDNLIFIHDATNSNLYVTSHYADAMTTTSTVINASKPDVHPTGQYVHYELMGTRGKYLLRFDDQYIGQKVYILYRAIIVGENGLPLITAKEQEGIAYRIAYEITQKNAYKGDQLALNLLPDIQAKSDIKMAATKIPEYVSQNFWDQVLRAMTRHDRKTYGYSYKPIT